ncbi:MAG: 3-phosphoshikimate 1-carboxyvinyltransferase [Chlamydiales bacterium]|jgi:3-phosphoshikimate 1-carboxyvinyltransferase|nr:3-phosphoshikimate 1-carboxyvinyltransferase [Chlamydiales bacterium]
MAKFYISPSLLQGSIAIPSSKSQTLRAIFFALMGKGRSRIHNYLPSPDTCAMIKAVESLGVNIQKTDTTLWIEGTNRKLKSPKNVINAENSGLVLRFIGALVSLLPTYTVITGDRSIRCLRPIQPLLSALQYLQVDARSVYVNGFAPISVKGPLMPGSAKLCGRDSQPVSALLMTTCFLEGQSHLQVTNPGEKPWIDLTLHWLKKLGAKIKHRNHEEYWISGKTQYEGFAYTVPGDWSSAAFPIAAALVTASEVILENLDLADHQGDKQIIHCLLSMGAHIEIDSSDKKVIIKKTKSLKGISIDVNHFVDAIAILAVIGCFAEGKTHLYNAQIARHKESDRIAAITQELKKMGANIEEQEDGLVVYPSSLKAARLYSHRDHRIAMALSVAALAAEGTSLIDGVECIAKTYPNFIRDFKHLGAKIEL